MGKWEEKKINASYHTLCTATQPSICEQVETSCFTFYKEGGGIVFRPVQEG